MNFTNVDSDWKKINEIIISCSKILLTTHENPDGDGLGSEVAMYHHLIEIGKDVKIINCSITPAMFDYINLNDCIETYDENNHLDWIKECELVVVFDVGDFSRTRIVKDAVEKFFKLIGQDFTDKTKFINIPFRPKQVLKDKGYGTE